jgi:glycosyltransferase involved in cell wall biosynthesis
MISPAISVAMTAYNGERHLAEAIDSILAQTFPHFELLIVDDHSTDQSRSIIEASAARDPRVRLVECAAKGRVPALNAIIDRARGEWLAVMDADDVAHPLRFERQMAFLAAHTSHGMIGTDTELIGPDSQPIERPFAQRPCSHEEITANLEEGVVMLHSAMIARTGLVREVGKYRAPFVTSQDYDLFLRLSTRTKMANLPDKLVSYRIYPEQVSTAKLVEQTLAAVVAWHSHLSRLEDRYDPIEGLERLPELGTLDTLFGRKGVDAYARKRIINRISYAPDLLAGEAKDILIRHIREVPSRRQLWRLAPRLALAGFLLESAQVAAALLAP